MSFESRIYNMWSLLMMEFEKNNFQMNYIFCIKIKIFLFDRMTAFEITLKRSWLCTEERGNHFLGNLVVSGLPSHW